MRRLVAALGAAVLVAVAAPMASAVDGAAPDTGVDATAPWYGPDAVWDPVLVEGDSVVFGDLPGHREHHVAAKGEDSNPGGGVSYHDGYATFGDPDLLPSYTVRLVDSSRADELAPFLDRAVQATADASGHPVRLQAERIRNQGTGRGHIDVVLSTTSPCGGAWLACGGPTIHDNVVESGRIWVHPKLLEHPPSEIDNTVRHELGHTLGLAHYTGSIDGRLQTMHPRRFDALRWEVGDRRGLRDLANQPLAPVVVLDDVHVEHGIIHVAGHVEDARSGTVLLLTVAGQTERRVLEHRNFRASQSAGGGQHEVCAAVERDGRPDGTVCRSVTVLVDPVGGLETVAAGPLGVEIVGWARDPDTPAPITVVVTVDGVDHEVVADEAHDPATHPEHGAAHGFSLIVPTAGGDHTVCATARNVRQGVDTALGCRVVTGSESTVGFIGLQTF